MAEAGVLAHLGRVRALTEVRRVVVGIGHVDLDDGGVAKGRRSAITRLHRQEILPRDLVIQGVDDRNSACRKDKDKGQGQIK